VKYLLDTNIISFGMRCRYGIDRRIESTPIDDLCTSIVVVAEGLLGCRRLTEQHPLRMGWDHVIEHWRTPELDLASVHAYAALRADLEASGRMIGPNDCLIAATALAWQELNPDEPITLVTDNQREFGRVEGLLVENWVE